MGARDRGSDCFGLERSDQIAVIIRDQIGLDGVELLLVVGLSRRAVDGELDLVRMLLLIGFRTGLDDVPELSGVGLEGHADLVGAVLRCGIRTARRSGVSAAAGCEAHCHRCCHQRCQKSLFHSFLSFSHALCVLHGHLCAFLCVRALYVLIIACPLPAVNIIFEKTQIDVLNFYIGLCCYTKRCIIIIEQIMNKTLDFV